MPTSIHRIFATRHEGHNSTDAIRSGLIAALALLCGGCGTLGYYAQAASGQLGLLAQRVPIARLLAAPDTDPALHADLTQALAVREFAVRELGLPAADSYLGYAALQRSAAVWNVIAAPPLALAPVRWCFPIAGCVAYRGYFSERRALDYAADLRTHGLDAHVAPAPAYSTLGWFDDPVLSTMRGGPPWQLAALIFHELAHHKLYVAGDSAFNEAFAVVVEEAGTRRWLRQQNDAALLARYRREGQAREQRLRRIVAAAEDLAAVYAAPWPEAERRAGKELILDRTAAALAVPEGQLNNAWLASLLTYRRYVPALRALLAGLDEHLPAYYAAAQELARLPAAQRQERLERLSQSEPARFAPRSNRRPGTAEQISGSAQSTESENHVFAFSALRSPGWTYSELP